MWKQQWIEVSRNTSPDLERWLSANFTKHIDAAPNEFLGWPWFAALIVHVRVVVQFNENGPELPPIGSA